MSRGRGALLRAVLISILIAKLLLTGAREWLFDT